MKENILKEVEKETKRRARKAKIEHCFQKSKEFLINNREKVNAGVPIVVGGIATVVKVVGKRSNLNKQEKLKDLYCYDRSLGHYWKLRRELTNKEWLEIDSRKKNGERLSDILSDMKVLD